ncbi:type IV secretion system protein [Cytobacillus purgationiresistens]|uniref:Uncharacterized protein n=1 Tax=Cytobacillus purgationiresistens TaxID=863449 RepID=A0ABU0AQA1_9BACI|nr:type IV secretion system protein [Cytobacillus purgationiresistens]MDQ0273492.1 hypothetical protein [Cytobacillus purgationiresistens]
MLGAAAEKIIEIFESLIKFLFDSLIEPFTGLSQLKDLVFGMNDDGKLVWSTFKASDLNDALNPVYYSMFTLSGFFIVAFIVIYGMRIAGAPINPHRRNELIEFFKDLLLVGIVLVNLPILYDLLFTINDGIIKMFNGAYESSLDKIKEETTEDVSGVMGYIFIQLILFGLMIWANFYYMMRKVTLIILMGMGPLMMVFWLHPQFKPITSSWLKELIGSIFVQSIHAFVFWTVATLSSTSDGFVETVIVYLIFIPISEAVRKLLGMGGDMQGGLSKAGAMLGMGALAGMYGSVKGAIGDKSVSGAIKGMYSGAKDRIQGKGNGQEEGTKTMGAMAGSDKGTTSNAEKMLKAGDITSRFGKAVAGMAGAVAGSPMGPVASIMGATAGSAAGGAIGGLAGRVGSSAHQGILARNRKGLDAFKSGGIGKNGAGFDENFANAVADSETLSWANQNKDAEMARLKELHPNASKGELENKFSQIAASKRTGFYNKAKSIYGSANKESEGFTNPSTMINASSDAMANQWAHDNKDKFLSNYATQNPQKAGESNEDYTARAMTAFTSKKEQMKNAFMDRGNSVASSLSGDPNEPISKKEFNSRLSSAIKDIPEVGNVNSISAAGNDAVNHVQGASLLQSSGKPNTAFLAGRMANMKTQDMKNEFIAAQTANGVSQATAANMWKEKMPSLHSDNLKMYTDSAKTADNATFSNGFAGSMERMQDLGKKSGSYLAAGSGIPGFVNSTKKLGSALSTGASQANASMAVNSQFGESGLLTTMSGVRQAATDGLRSTFDSIAEQSGGAVQAQQNFQNVAGYSAGMLFGAKAYQGAKSLASRHSPFANQVQNEIKSPSEVIQMAQTVTDDHGNKMIAPGAIRQVFTPNESYVEVRTKSGDSQIVSRKSAGHSGLRSGDVVYQDLDMQGDSLIARSSSSGAPSTYRLDSGGGRVPTPMNLSSNPNELLGNPSLRGRHSPISKPNVPSYSQSVDAGQFHIEDMVDSGMENFQVVMEKDRQFVTGSKEGVTYRLSPIFSGDSRLQNDETIQIPVKVDRKQLKPLSPTAGSSIAINSTNGTPNMSTYTDYNQTPTTPYYSAESISELITSRDTLRINRGLNKRKQIDLVRRKQGLLG